MRKILLLSGLFFLLSIYTVAQSKPDYSGDWTLNKEKSVLDSRQLIDTVTLKVTQTEKDLTVDRKTVRTPPPENSKIMVSGGSGTAVYPLDGKEMTIERESFRGKIPTTIKGEILANGKLSLNSSFMGLFNNVEGLSKNNQIWELSDNGKTLKIMQTNSTPLGETKTEMIFTKN